MGAIVHSRDVLPAERTRGRGHTSPRGRFFTLPVVADFLWQVVERLAPATEPRRIVDLAAGDGVLLDAACRVGETRPCLALGFEIDDGAGAAVADGVTIHAGDGLLDGDTELPADSFDIVVGNPPFGRSRDLLTEAQRVALEAHPGKPLAIWGPAAVDASGHLTAAAGNARVEALFVERALRLVRPGGLIAYILPDGLLGNRQQQGVRDWIARRADLLASIALPSSAFRRAGLNVLTHLVVLRAGDGASTAWMMQRRHARRGQLPRVLDGLLADLDRAQRGDRDPGTVAVTGADLHGGRWDPAHWVGRRTFERATRGRRDMVPLGDLIELLTYGPIVTGGRPRTVQAGIPSIRQGDFSDTGLVPTGFVRVAPGSDHDPARSRVRRGDVLMPRSGGGALGHNRVAVYEEAEPANVGCFVNLIRPLPDLNSYYLWVFLRSRLGWLQIRSLMNGVGTPNISFAALRTLRVPVLPAAEQGQYERLCIERVRPLHVAALTDEGLRPRAEQAFCDVVERLDRQLAGGVVIPED